MFCEADRKRDLRFQTFIIYKRKAICNCKINKSEFLDISMSNLFYQFIFVMFSKDINKHFRGYSFQDG